MKKNIGEQFESENVWGAKISKAITDLTSVGRVGTMDGRRFEALSLCRHILMATVYAEIAEGIVENSTGIDWENATLVNLFRQQSHQIPPNIAVRLANHDDDFKIKSLSPSLSRRVSASTSLLPFAGVERNRAMKW